MLHPERASIAEFKAQALIRGSTEIQFLREAIKGVVHGERTTC
jgi:hypothetical protein